MKKATHLFTVFSLLTATIAANGTPFQQPAGFPAKETGENTVSLYPAPEEGLFSIGKKATSFVERDSTLDLIDTRYKVATDRLEKQAASIKEYAKANHYSTEYCFLVDMSIPSGKKRFFVYNMKTNSVENSSLVAHGWGSCRPGNDQLAFSNTPSSCQTSLGRYKIGYSYNGTFGLAFKLYGLDNTNSKAFERAIVLHAYGQIPDSETYPDQIAESAGCPMVSPFFLTVLSKYIKSSQKPILLWIYN